MKHIKILVALSFTILILFGCSEKSYSIEVKGEKIQVEKEVINVITKKEENAVKIAYPKDRKPDIEINYDGQIYKIYFEKRSAVVDSEHQNKYEIIQEELDIILNAINN